MQVMMQPTQKPARLVAATPPGVTSPLYCAEFAPFSALCRVDEEFFDLRTPYIVSAYDVKRSKVFLSCRTSPLTDDDRQLYYFPFPHIQNKQGRVCMGGHVINGDHPDPLEKVTAGVVHFFQTGFWYYYVDPELPKVADGPAIKPVSTFPKAPTRANVIQNFTWWEQRSLDEILTFTYEPIESLEAWLRTITAEPLEYLI